MEFVGGKSYFCKKSYGENYYHGVNQFLMYTKSRNRYSGNLNDYDCGSYYNLIRDPKFTAGNIYRCKLWGTITDDTGNFVNIGATSIDPDSFVEINLGISESAKKIIGNLNRYGVTVEILPYEVVGGKINNGVIENPDVTITEFKVRIARVGTVVSPGRLSGPPIFELGTYKVKGDLSDEIDKALYAEWRKIRIKSPWCSAIHKTLNHRLSIEKENKIRELKK